MSRRAELTAVPFDVKIYRILASLLKITFLPILGNSAYYNQAIIT